MPSEHAQRLIELYHRVSKHSAYQVLAPSVARILGDPRLGVRSRHETLRLDCIRSCLTLDGARVLDIGGNTGFFTFSAIEHGAASVDYYEGNSAHARFIEAAAKALDLEDRLRVRAEYFTFEAGQVLDRFDVSFCLNVIHHLGEDFNDRINSIDDARAQMIACINALANISERLVLQLGFNWKGNVQLPLFDQGLKREMISFVSEGTASAWKIENIYIAEDSKRGVTYVPATETNLQRFEHMGEFLNRPLFFMKSRSA